MASRTKAKQISRIFSGNVQITNFTTTAASSDNVTAIITSALSTASDTGGSVPVQPSTGNSVVGIIVNPPTNRSEIEDTTTKQKIDADGQNAEVYGRVTESAPGVYTLSYYFLDGGTQTAYTFGSATAIDFSFSYRFQFDAIPADAFIALTSTQIADDPKTIGTKLVNELLTVTGTNALSDISFTPTAASALKLVINGVTYHSGAGEPVGLTGSTPTWTPAAFGTVDAWNIETDDTVYAKYPRV